MSSKDNAILIDKKCEATNLSWDKGDKACLQEHTKKLTTIPAVCEISPVALASW